MLYKIIRKERLNQFRNKICQLKFLQRKKNEIINTFGLKGVDYSRTKVTAGNRRRLTEQERAVLSVEKYDLKIKELAAEIEPERQELQAQINRVDEQSTNWRHAESLRSYYLEGLSKKDTAIDIYGSDDKKDVDNVSDLLKTAIELLAEVSSTPFVRVEQIPLEVWKV